MSANAAWTFAAFVALAAAMGPSWGQTDPTPSSAPESTSPGAGKGGIVAVRGKTVHTMSGAPIEDGIVIIEAGKIRAVGPASRTSVPSGAEVIEAAVVTPGLIDAHSVVGLTGYLNQPGDQEQLERSEPIQPELRAIDGYDARERLIGWVRSFGVTTIHTGHAPAALVSGQTLIAKTRGETVDQAVIVPVAMVAATLGGDALEREGKKSPGTRSKAVAMLRAQLIKAREYGTKQKLDDVTKRPARDLRLEILGRVLDREIPLLINAQRHQDILSALRVAKEFDLKIVLDGAAEAHLVLNEIKAAGVPVLPHPTMMRAYGEMENATMELPARLQKAGIPFALQSGYEDYVPKTRVVLFEAGVAAAYGLPRERALAAITSDAARLLGLDARLGSLAPGKDGDIALWDGDPLEYTTHCLGVLIDGQRFPGEKP